MENFGIQVGSLQHVLEGYKVAEEIAQHGAGAPHFPIGGLINSKFMTQYPC